jgi:hypothetical protein
MLAGETFTLRDGMIITFSGFAKCSPGEATRGERSNTVTPR